MDLQKVRVMIFLFYKFLSWCFTNGSVPGIHVYLQKIVKEIKLFIMALLILLNFFSFFAEWKLDKLQRSDVQQVIHKTL